MGVSQGFHTKWEEYCQATASEPALVVSVCLALIVKSVIFSHILMPKCHVFNSILVSYTLYCEVKIPFLEVLGCHCLQVGCI